MAYRSENTLISNREMLVELILTPLRALGGLIERMAISNSRTQALIAINEISDEELRAKGLSRADVVSMTFRHDA